MKYRYREPSEMKDSGVEWLGLIPRAWEVKPHKYIMAKKKKICDSYLGENILSLTKKGVIIRDLENPSGKMPVTFDGYQQVNKGNLLLCLFDIDVTPRCVGLIKHNGLTSPAYSQFVLKKGNVNYYNYLLTFIDDQKSFLHLSKNLRNSLTEENFGSINTIYFLDSDQEKIANFLDQKYVEFDSVIAKKENLIEKLEEAKKSLINEVVTGKVKILENVDGNYEVIKRESHEMKESGVEWLGMIPREWSRSALKHLVKTKITDGPHETPEIKKEGVPFLSAESIINNKISILNMRGYITREQYEIYAKKSKVYKNDILFCKSGSTTGKSALVQTNEIFGIWSPLAIIRANHKINYKNLFYVIQSKYFRIQVENYWTFGTQPNIGMSVLENLIVPYSKEAKEQEKIYNFLDEKTGKIDFLIEKQKHIIEKLKLAKQSLISEAVTGKIEIL